MLKYFYRVIFLVTIIFYSCTLQPGDGKGNGSGINRPEPPSIKKIYWATDGGAIKCTDITNTNIITVITNNLGYTPGRLEIDSVNKKMYWNSNNKIYRSDLDGKNAELLAEGLGFCLDPAGNKMYYTTNGCIFQCDMSTKQTNLFLNQSGGSSIGVDKPGNKIYWGSIYRANLDGSGIEQFYKKDAQLPIYLDIYKGKIYFCPNLAGGIRQIDMDGSNEKYIAVGNGFIFYTIFYIAIDSKNDRLFLNYGKWIISVNTDGTGQTNFITESSDNVQGIGLEME